MNTEVPGAVDLRQSILTRLSQLEKSPFWLSQEQKVVHPNTAQFFLYNGRSIRLPALGRMMALVGLGVYTDEEVLKLRQVETEYIGLLNRYEAVKAQEKELATLRRLEKNVRELLGTSTERNRERCRERTAGTLKVLDRLRGGASHAA